ncbi:SDR family NAD(P)-dependent oxidoreductase [Thalassovita sp.]|uniref:SDR family NAD(P)-dependent oxidoreductase n=1 Tax=Thalassovita sp. TaxID=1979401 RepID=UPI0029DE82E4|nr:SDR family NAD(P)-dependent oxidoreductase [Thalassovita sp.]
MNTAVITGGAGGLGRALCRQLVQDGWQVVLMDLPSPALEAMQSPQVSIVPCDLTDEPATQAACRRVTAAHPAIGLVIYNAGITQIAEFDGSDLTAHRRVFAVNYFAAVTVAHGLLRAVRRARGTHLAISSVAGFAPLHRRTSYAASKHALEGFFKSLRSEEAPHGVHCLIAAPSFVATNIGNSQAQPDGIARPGSAPDGIDYISPEEAARVILAGWRKRKPFIPVGRVARLAWWLNRLSPGQYEKQMNKRIARR